MHTLINIFNRACKEGNLEQVKYLIKNTSLNINRQDNHSNTGFHYACIKGHLSIVEYCIKNTNLNVNIQNNNKNTGFHYACLNGHLAIVEYFKVDAFACFWHFVPKSKQMYLPGPLRYKKYKFKC